MPGDLSADLSLSAGLTEIGNSVRTTSGDFETKSRLIDSPFFERPNRTANSDFAGYVVGSVIFYCCPDLSRHHSKMLGRTRSQKQSQR